MMATYRSAPIYQTVTCLDVDGRVVCPPLSGRQRAADRAGALVRQATTCGPRRPPGELREYRLLVIERCRLELRETDRLLRRSAVDGYLASQAMEAKRRRRGLSPLSADPKRACAQLGRVASDVRDHALLEKVAAADGLRAYLLSPENVRRFRELVRAYCEEYGTEPGGRWDAA